MDAAAVSTRPAAATTSDPQVRLASQVKPKIAWAQRPKLPRRCNQKLPLEASLQTPGSCDQTADSQVEERCGQWGRLGHQPGLGEGQRVGSWEGCHVAILIAGPPTFNFQNPSALSALLLVSPSFAHAPRALPHHDTTHRRRTHLAGCQGF